MSGGLLRRAGPLLLAAAAVGCAARPGGGGPPAGADDSAEAVTRARIVNQQELQMRVHLVVRGRESLLGSVPPFSERVFELSETRLGGLREVSFRADPIGSTDSWRSGEIHVPPGETVTWYIRRP